MTADQIINIGLVLVLVATLGGLVYYLYRLRRDFYEACRETGNLELFANSPMGIPIGSVRSTLALVIVLFAVGYVGVTGVADVPQFLTAIVSTVLGFYFGSRSSRDSQQDLRSMMDRMASQSQSAGTTESPSTTDGTARRQKAQALLARLEEGLSITEVARSVLPQPLRRQFASLVDGLQNGIETVRGLLEAHSVEDALRKADGLLDRFETENPVRTLVERALGSFGTVLGTAVPPLPLLGSIVGVATTVKQTVYDRWKKRILHLPFEPTELPVERVDANTGFTLLSTTPILKAAFRDELEANDRPFLEDTAEELLSTGELGSLWADYSDRFDSRQQFEDGVDALRRAAADLELREELDDALFEDVGGYEQTVAAIDELRTDEAAGGDLDAIVTMLGALRTADGISASSVQELFETVRAALRSNETSS